MTKLSKYYDYVPTYFYRHEDDEEVLCLLAVTHIIVKSPDHSCRDSDVDYYGYREVEYDVLYMDKTPAYEIEELATKHDRERWEEEIYEAHKED
jgi:hypothetical protein